MQRPFFHFSHIGYRRNPFGALTDEEWVAVAVLPPAIERILDTGFEHLQILGPMGIGKSTTLLALQSCFEKQKHRDIEPQRDENEKSVAKVSYEYLPEGQRYFETDTTELDVFLLDEAQRLNRWQRRRLVKVGGNGRLRLIISSHEDLTPLFARKGLRLTSVDLTGELDEAWVTAVLNKRLAYFALPNQARATLTPAAISYLYQTFGENLRQMEYFLYEVWQYLQDTSPVDVSFLVDIG